MQEIGDSNVCFEGDLSDVPRTVRKLTIRLKAGNTIDYENESEFEALVENADEVRKQLNADFLDLYIDEENEVAWAEGVRGETTYLQRPKLTMNHVAIFLAISKLMFNRIQDGYDQANGWITNKQQLKDAYSNTSDRYSEDGRDNVTRGYDAAVNQAIKWHWIEKIEDDSEKLKITTHVMALIKRGFAKELVEEMKNAEEEKTKGWK